MKSNANQPWVASSYPTENDEGAASRAHSYGAEK